MGTGYMRVWIGVAIRKESYNGEMGSVYTADCINCFPN